MKLVPKSCKHFPKNGLKCPRFKCIGKLCPITQGLVDFASDLHQLVDSVLQFNKQAKFHKKIF